MPSSQGTTVSFGTSVGSLLGVTVTSHQAQTSTATSMDGTVLGTSGDSRIVSVTDCTTVDPGSVSIRLLGSPGWTNDDIGSKDTLTVSADGGSISAEAILVKFEFEAAVGELIKGSAEFVFTGE